MNGICLYHHGIKGQRWGVRRFQNKDGSRTSQGKIRQNVTRKVNKDEERNEHKGLTDNQKKWIKRGAIAGGIALAAVGGYALYKSGALNPAIDRIRAKGQNNLKQYSDMNPDLSSYSKKVQDAYYAQKSAASRMNPTGSHINCGPCSILLHVNDRLGTSHMASSEAMSEYSGLSKYFKGWSIKNAVQVNKGGLLCDNAKETYSDMIEYMTGFGEGASGVCSGKWTKESGRGEGGHFLEWKVVDNTVIFTDGQNGNVYLKDAFSRVFSDMEHESIGFARLDTFEINKDALGDLIYKEK